MAEAGFCASGEQEKLLADSATEIAGPMPVNTDSGLIANGEPIGASGLAAGARAARRGRQTTGPRSAAGRVRAGLRRSWHCRGNHSDYLMVRTDWG
jgi:acetyl-CoA C-acetyltransferase